MNFEHLKSTYFQECAELLESVYTHLAALEQDRADAETVHAIFRAIHSIKGGGGAFGFERMVAFAHVLETLLDLLRDDRILLAPDIAALLLRATDVLSDLIGAERTGKAAAAGLEAASLGELGRAVLLDRGVPSISTTPPGASTTSAPSASPQRQAYRIRFLPHADLFRNANEPLLLIRELKRLGALTATALLDGLPPLERMDPEDAYIGWTIDILTDAPVSRLEEVFEFVTDHCDLAISAMSPIDGLPGEMTAPVNEPMPQLSSSAGRAVDGGATPPDHPPGEPRCALESVRVDASGAPRKEILAATAAAPAGTQTIRVDVEKVDRLVNLVGELVINQAMLVQLGGVLPPDMCPGLINGLETLSQHLRELQDGVMAIRTQPVKSVFSRMPRLVRELSAQLGKEARLVITGEATEIDKTVIEQLADPLTHLLRNALDHGIEAPHQRTALGKPAQGTIHLSAEHRGGRIVIELSDDGHGIDRARVLARARERGLVGATAQPSEEEIDNLIFLPGFSTVDVVSSISGRGVGMDVVRRNIQALGGRITLQSRARAGSRFVLSLPLTLAILDGMIVAVGRQSYVVPLTNIVESLRPKPGELHAVVGCGDVVAIRGAYIPLIHLARCFGVPEAVSDPSRGIVVVVESEGAGQVGLVVDELVGQQQVVVKSLETNYGPVDGVGGATILGDGRVALILDIAGLREAAAGEIESRTVEARRCEARTAGARKFAATSVIQ